VAHTVSASAPDQPKAGFLSRYGPWAVVTGASDGIGRQFANCLAKADFNLVLVARRRTALESLAGETRTRYGIETRVLNIDLGRSEAVESLQMQTCDLDIGLLIAAAGFGASGRLIDARSEQEIEMLHVNCRSVLELSLIFGRRFAERGRGGIILLSSLLGFQGAPFAAHYAATKAYIQSLAEGLHVEMAPLGVDVLASAPGPVHSGFAARAGMQMGLAAKPEDVAQKTLNALGHRTTIVPGLLSKFLTYSLLPLPRSLRTQIMCRIMQGMTKHRDGAISGQNPKPA
jgi:uncharacterized protein